MNARMVRLIGALIMMVMVLSPVTSGVYAAPPTATSSVRAEMFVDQQGDVATYKMYVYNNTGGDIGDLFIAASVPTGSTFIGALDSPAGSWFRGVENAGSAGSVAVWLCGAVSAGSVRGPFTFQVKLPSGSSGASHAWVAWNAPAPGNTASPEVAAGMTSAPTGDANYAQVGDISMYYEVHGVGEPLILIAGLGSDSNSWHFEVPVLSKKFQVIVFDNRGSGRTTKWQGTYTIELMAKDTVGLMDALGIKSAHILGHSMGGFIAQEVALSYPDRVRSLILSDTMPGNGPKTVTIPNDARVLAILDAVKKATNPDEAARANARLACVESTIQSKWYRIQERGKYQNSYPTPADIRTAQNASMYTYFPQDRLPGLTMPTLILQGIDDLLVNVGNADVFASLIKGSRVVLIPYAGHNAFIDQPELWLNAVMQFVMANSKG